MFSSTVMPQNWLLHAVILKPYLQNKRIELLKKTVTNLWPLCMRYKKYWCKENAQTCSYTNWPWLHYLWNKSNYGSGNHWWLLIIQTGTHTNCTTIVVSLFHVHLKDYSLLLFWLYTHTKLLITFKYNTRIISLFVSSVFADDSNLISIKSRTFKKIYISCFGTWCVYSYFPENSNIAALFRNMVSINY